MAKQFITVGEFRNRLSKFDQDSPVCIADWNEEHMLPSSNQALCIEEVEGQFLSIYDEKTKEPRIISGRFVKIG